MLEAADAESWLEWVRGWPLVETGPTRRAGLRDGARVGRAGLVAREQLEAHARRVEARLHESRREAKRLLAAKPTEDPDADVLARLTRARSIDARGRWSSREPATPGDAWHRRWSAHEPDYGVVYGHWATQGLHVARNLRGLDTGCVYHGAFGDRYLTAWLPPHDAATPFAIPDEHFWRIPGRGRSSRVRGEKA